MKDGLLALRRFNAKVTRLEESGFAKRYTDDIPNVIAKFEDPVFRYAGDGKFEITGRIASHLEHFDQDEIDAFILTHRILTQNNDSISVASLAKVYAKGWMPEGARAPFNDAREQLNDYLGTAATVEFPDQQITIRNLADIIIYGGLAHTNKQKTAIFENWMNSGMAGFFWAEFFAYAREMLRYFCYFKELNEAVLQSVGASGAGPED